MYDAALLMRVPQMTQAAGELGRALARVGGYMEWTAVPAAVESFLTDRDYIKIASWGALPTEVGYLVLLTYVPDAREDDICELWDVFVDAYGIAQQPTQVMEDLVDQWQEANHGQPFTLPAGCGEVTGDDLPMDNTTNFLHPIQQGTVAVNTFVLDSQGSGVEQVQMPTADYAALEMSIAEMVSRQDDVNRADFFEFRTEHQNLPHGETSVAAAEARAIRDAVDAEAEDEAAADRAATTMAELGAQLERQRIEVLARSLLERSGVPVAEFVDGDGTLVTRVGDNDGVSIEEFARSVLAAGGEPGIMSPEAIRELADGPDDLVLNLDDIDSQRATLAAIFGRAGETSVAPAGRPSGMSAQADAAWRRTYSRNITPRRQREAFQRRQEEAERVSCFHIDWYATTTWSTPAGQPGEEAWAYQIDQMEDQHLWSTIIWLVRNCSQLYIQYVEHRGDGALALESKTWLRTQPAFRALLHEAVGRELTFPKDVYKYLRDYVLGRGDESVQPSSPWKDPGAGYQTSQLEAFLDEPVVPEESIEDACGKNLRDIVID
jgi:hypothetical protein